MQLALPTPWKKKKEWVHHFPQPFFECTTALAAAKAEHLGHGKWRQMAPVTPGRRATATSGTVGQLAGGVWPMLYALEVWQRAVQCCSRFASLGRELLRNLAFRRPWGEPASQKGLLWPPQAPTTVAAGEGWLQCQVKCTAASVLGILWRSTGEARSHMCTEKTIYVFDPGHNTQKLLRGRKQHRNLTKSVPMRAITPRRFMLTHVPRGSCGLFLFGGRASKGRVGSTFTQSSPSLVARVWVSISSGAGGPTPHLSHI